MRLGHRAVVVIALLLSSSCGGGDGGHVPEQFPPTAETRAWTALRVVGLEDRIHYYPRQMSGGQEQRVAIARAIVNDPSIIIADEPTGDLDRKSADDVLDLLETLSKELGRTILMVTHDPLAAGHAEVVRKLDKGTLE